MAPVKQRVRHQLDPDLVRWLRAEAKRRRCSMSQVIRDLIFAEISRQREDEK